MVNERPRQFAGIARLGGAAPRPGLSTASSSASRATQLGIGLGKGAAGLGKGMAGVKRHHKLQRDGIKGVTMGDIRRLARRGGIKRISASVYDEARQALKARLTSILHQVVAVLESGGRKTVTVSDVIFVLNHQGRPIYGFDPAFAGRS